VVIAPGGKVLYRSGALDIADFQARLVDMLGVYYKKAP